MPSIGLRLAACVLLVVGIVAAAPAGAQTKQQSDWCEDKDNTVPPDLAIGGCTAVIQSGRWSGKNLAWAFSNRGLAYVAKKDYDRAIADHNQAIRLNPSSATAFNSRGLTYRAKKDYDRTIRTTTRRSASIPASPMPFGTAPSPTKPKAIAAGPWQTTRAL